MGTGRYAQLCFDSAACADAYILSRVSDPDIKFTSSAAEIFQTQNLFYQQQFLGFKISRFCNHNLLVGREGQVCTRLSGARCSGSA